MLISTIRSMSVSVYNPFLVSWQMSMKRNECYLRSIHFANSLIWDTTLLPTQSPDYLRAMIL
jgi:hypothetical protein